MKSAANGRLATDSLAAAMLLAARATLRVRHGLALPRALALELPVDATAQSRGAMQDLAYRTMRGRGRGDVLVKAFSERPVDPPLLNELLVVAFVLLQPDDDAGVAKTARYSDFTVVDQAVDACASVPELRRGRGFANAVLREGLRQKERWGALFASSTEGLYNYPSWWVARLRRAYPTRWMELLRAGDRPPPLTLRVNARRQSTAQFLALLTESGIAADAIGPSAVRLKDAVGVHQIPGFDAGFASVQDEGAQRAATLLDVQDGQRVLDACAAPGGKTGHLLEIADIDLTALDTDAARLARVADNLHRLGLKAHLVEGDASTPADWFHGALFDRILADAPCTASGIIRRHPDIRWLRREADVLSLSRQQQHILDALWSLLVVGGKLLFVTCSIFPEECQLQSDRFLAQHPDALLLPAPGQLLPTAAGSVDHDGLFYSLFLKTA